MTSALVEQCKLVLEQAGRVQTHGLAAQLLAELAKNEAGRTVCLGGRVVTSLETALKEQSECQSGGLETVVQVRNHEIIKESEFNFHLRSAAFWVIFVTIAMKEGTRL